MSYIKTKGIVIREVNTGEADKIITIFTRSQGKISAMAKGARRPKSKFVAGTQYLCYSDFVLFNGREKFSINSCDVIEPFYELRNDIVRLTYSAHIVDIVNDAIQENQPSSKVLQLFLNTLHMLTKTDKSPELVTRIYELRLLSILGYAPYVKGCMICGCEELDRVLFSFRKCGFICSKDNCLTNDQYALNIQPGTARAFNHIIYAKMKDLFSFNLSGEVLEELGKISRRYLRDRLERDYIKLDFLKTLEL